MNPNDFVLFAYGGAGPLRAADLARELGFKKVVIPRWPGVTSALGLLLADVKFSYVQTVWQRGFEADYVLISRWFREKELESRRFLLGLGFSSNDITFHRALDMRYEGQSWEVEVPIPSSEFNKEAIEQAVRAFHSRYEGLYAYHLEDHPVEIVNVKLTVVGRRKDRPVLEVRGNLVGDISRAFKGIRPVYFDECKGFVDCKIYERESLLPGDELDGPSVIEQYDSTTVLYPGQRGVIDQFGNIVIGDLG